MRCPAGHARSMTIRLPPSLSARCARRRPTQHTGRSAPWLEITGFSHTTIRRIWTAFGLQPHRSETFKLSSDPLFVDKVRDIVGLYLSPPNRALVLSVDEKSQIQALDRETAGSADDAWRAGAPDPSPYLSWYDFVICRARCRLGFCHRQMLQAPPRDRISRLPQADRRSGSQRPRRPHQSWTTTLPIKRRRSRQWLARRPHYHAHFTPTSASWINQVERWFAELTQRSSGGVHTSTRQLEADIRFFIERHNENPGPSAGHQSADEILSLRQAILPEGRTDIMWRTLDSRD